MKKKRFFRGLERPGVKKLWIMMKLTALLLMVSGLAVATGTYSQNARFDLSVKNATIIEVMEEVERITDYGFLFKTDQLDLDATYTLNLKGARIDQVMAEILDENLYSYRMMDRIIVISRKGSDFMQSADQRPSAISGKVTDTRNMPLPGVTVVVKGTTQGTVTDANGQFSLTSIPADAVLQFSFVGMRSQEITPGGQTDILVKMEEETVGIEEVVAIGYGVRKKINLTGAVSQVTEEVLKDRPINNVGQGLQGIIPNLQVTFPDGDPKSSPSYNIRGTATISGEGGSPLILVDGIPMNMNMLNPNDIESISVLKDAASAAIYGARGAFGVVLVTTKKGGKERQPQFNYSGSVQFNTHTYLPDVFNGVDYMNAANEAQFNSTKTYRYTEEQIQWVKDYNEDPVNNPVYHVMANGKIFWNRGLNSYKEMIRDWSPTQKHSLSVSGGTERLNYFASAGYHNQEGLFKDASDIFKRYNFTINLQMDATDWFRLGFKSSYNRTSHDEPHRFTGKGSSWWEQMTRGEPQILYPVYTPDDSPVGGGVPTEHFFNFLKSGSRNNTQVETGVFSLNGEADIFKGFVLKADFSYRTFNSRNKDFIKTFGFIRDSWQLQYNHTSPSYASRETAHEDFFSTNFYGDYTLSLNDKHNFHGLLGFNQEWSEYESFYAKREGLISGDFPVINLGTGLDYTDDSEHDWALRGVFMRLNYDYMGKYLFEMNGRYDGTSKFPKNSRFDFFPSVSLGWRISQESFMEGVGKVADDIKLRASYGSLGNQNVSGNYPYISNFGIDQQVPYIINGVLPIGLTPPGLVAADLTWETSTTMNFGIDATLLKRLNMSFDWYERNTRDMLTAGDKLPAVLGTGVPRRNNAELSTRGWELVLGWRDQLKNGFKYDAGLVLSDYLATVTKFDNNPNKIYTTYYVGQKIGEIWGYETVGLFQSAEEVAAAPNQNRLGNNGKWGPGDVRYANLNDDDLIDWGDRTVSNPGDTKIIGNTTPRYQFGVTGNAAFKGFDLNVFFQGIGKRDFMPVGNYFWGHNANAVATGNYDVWRNSWRENNTDAYFPIYEVNSAFNRQTQTRYLQSGSYIRLKNFTLGYSVPARIISGIKLTNLRFYFSGYNLWEYKWLRGNFDPEQVGNLGEHYPMQRSVLFGIDVTL